MAYKPGAKGGNREFGLVGAGKGDKSRVTDLKKFRENFDEIDWGHRPKYEPPNLRDLPTI